MPSPAAIVRSCLIDLELVKMPGVAQVPGVTPLPGSDDLWCFVGMMPDDYDRAMTINDVAGIIDGREMRSGRRHLFPGLKFIIRDLEYNRGYDLANTIAVALDTLPPTTTIVPEDGLAHYIQAITRTSPIISLGEEAGRRRQLWSINARISFQALEPSLG